MLRSVDKKNSDIFWLLVPLMKFFSNFALRSRHFFQNLQRQFCSFAAAGRGHDGRERVPPLRRRGALFHHRVIVHIPGLENLPEMP